MKTTKLILTAVIAILLGIGNAAFAFDPNANLSLAPNKYDHDGWTPVHHLAKLGEHKKLKDLITKFGGKPQFRTRDDNEQTPLHIAAQYGHIKAVEVLLADRRMPMDSWDAHGGTALHSAAGGAGKVRVMEMLIGAGANPHNINLRGQTPMHLAAAKGNRAAIEALVKAGADINATDKGGRTPMHSAARHDRGGVIYTISKAGGGKETKDGGGLTPLQLAVSFGKTNSARELTKIGARTNMFTDWDENGRKAIHNAASNGNAGMVKTLVDLGYDKEIKSGDDWRPLHYAARNNHADAVKVLIEAGADPYAETKEHSAIAIELAEAHHGYESAAAEALRAKQYVDFLAACTKHSPEWMCRMGYHAWRLRYGNERPT